MPPLASAFAYEVDRAIERAYVLPQSAGAWATLHALRPVEAEAAFRGRGPLTAFLPAEPGGAHATIHNGLGSVMGVTPVGLGALASTCNASVGAYRLPTFPNA